MNLLKIKTNIKMQNTLIVLQKCLIFSPQWSQVAPQEEGFTNISWKSSNNLNQNVLSCEHLTIIIRFSTEEKWFSAVSEVASYC